jgi:3-dehydrosphinganine reductase
MTMLLRLVASGVLFLPAAVVMIVTMPVVALLSLPAAALLTFRKKSSADKEPTFRRAIITGGSSGIGLAVAHECVKKGFDQVVIIARNVKKLKAAQESLEKATLEGRDTKILALSVDVSSLNQLEEASTKIFANDTEKSSTYLFCCAGQAVARRFCDLTEDMILLNAKTNQLGATFTVRALLPHMKAGTIMLCSSVSDELLYPLQCLVSVVERFLLQL